MSIPKSIDEYIAAAPDMTTELVEGKALPGAFGDGVKGGGHEASPSKLAASRVIRPVMSAGPPAANGTITVTVRDG